MPHHILYKLVAAYVVGVALAMLLAWLGVI